MAIERWIDDKKFISQELSRVAECLEIAEIVGWDADQIIIGSEVPATRAANELFKTSHSSKDMRWQFIRDLAIARGYSEIDAQILDEYIWSDEDILFHSPPVPGGIEAFRLVGITHENRIVTSRLPRLEGITRKWFSHYIPELPQDKLHINKNPLIPGDLFKGLTIDEEGISIFFEDLVRQAGLILEKAKKAYVVLVSSSADTDAISHPRLFKVPNMRLLHAFLTGNPV